MKRLIEAISLIGITIGTFLAIENVARADRSLANAMSDSATIAQVVSDIESFNGIVCDTENSNQT